jgi:hypothetical protein
MWKATFMLLVLASVALAQSSSDGSFSVHHSKRADFSLSPTQMREAEGLYQSACATVQNEFHDDAGKLHPHFTVVIGAEGNMVRQENTETHVGYELWLKEWNPAMFAEGVVVLAFNQMLTPNRIKQLGDRAVRFNNATVDVSGLK